MTRNRSLGLAIAALVFVIDQAIKYMITGPLDLMHRVAIELVPVFRLSFVANQGVSFGLFRSDTPMGQRLLIAGTAAVAAGVTWWLWREKNRQDIAALGLVLGGALGNIVDRARLGYVVDFADLHFGDFRPFLVFNAADAAITVGVLILLARAFLVGEKPANDVKVTDDA